ncbi:MAG: hypothetical protein AB7T63_16855 [Planctomycetota bacterium]
MTEPLATVLASVVSTSGEGAPAWRDVPAAWGPRLAARARTPDVDDEPPGEDDPALRVLGHHGRQLVAVLGAVHEAGDAGSLDRDRIGLFVATDVVDPEPDDVLPALRASLAKDGRFDLARFFGGGFRSLHPLWPLAQLNNVAVGQVAIDLAVRGENAVFGSEADAGVRAVLEAAWSVREGHTTASLVGATAPRPGAFAEARAYVEGWPPGRPLGQGAAALLLGTSPAPRPRGAVSILAGTTGHGATDDATSWEDVIEHALAAAGGTSPVVVHATEEPALTRALAALGLSSTARRDPEAAVGHLGPASAMAVVAGLDARPGEEPAGAHLLLVRGPNGGRGALVLEVA